MLDPDPVRLRPHRPGPSIGTLVIDGDTNFDTTADQTLVPLSAYVVGFKRKCKKMR